jgi:uncharacterized protein (TIGR02246 family)
MKSGIPSALFAAAILVVASSAQAEDVRRAIETGNAKWNEAFNKKDAAALTAMYAPDAKLLPPANTVVSGPAEIHKFWQSMFDGGFADHQIKLIDAQGAGNMAYEAAQWQATGPGKGGARQTYKGSVVMILERQGGNDWKAKVHTWNVAAD